MANPTEEEDTNLYAHQRGWWKEDSAIDALDKKLSKVVFSLELGRVVETVLTIPGTWFGLPVSAFTLSNVLTYIVLLEEEIQGEIHWFPDWMRENFFDSHHDNFILVFSLCIVAWGGLYFYHLFQDQIVRAYLATRRLLIPSLIFPVWLGRTFSSTAYRAGTFFLVSWMVSQMITSGLKLTAARMRPMVARSSRSHVLRVNRAFPSLQSMLGVGESIFESFPSGDTVGAANFSCVLFMLDFRVSSLVCLVTAFCRMYFHAHHLLDVVVGLVIGWCVPLALRRTGMGLEFFDVKRTAGVVALFFAFFIRLQKHKPAVPEHLQVKGRKGF